MEKAEKYYQMHLKIRALSQELQQFGTQMTTDERSKKIRIVTNAYRALGDLENCARFLEGYVQNGEEDEEVVDFYIRIKEIEGRALARKGDFKGAKAAFETALHTAGKYDMDFKRMDMYQSISTIYEKIGNYKQALFYYDEFVKLSTQVYKERNYAYSKYLIDVYGLGQLQQKMSEAAAVTRRLEHQADVDSLTGIYNRRFLHEALQGSIFPEDAKGRLAVVMMDLDYFKQYNDTYGHTEGDEVLRIVGDILQGMENECIYPVRYGGEEFLLLLREPQKGEAVKVVERIMNALRKRAVEHKGSKVSDIVTLSAGIAEGVCRFSEQRHALIEEADNMLYEAKKTRNCWRKIDVMKDNAVRGW